MPAHIYIRTGQYAKSAKSNADAAAVDEKYIKATGATGLYPMMYYGHNLQFESAAAMFSGNLAQARAAQRTVQFADPIADQMVMIEPFAAMELAVATRFGMWGLVLGTKAPPPARACRPRSITSRGERRWSVWARPWMRRPSSRRSSKPPRRSRPTRWWARPTLRST